VNRNPIDSLRGKDSVKCKPESHGAAGSGPKQERHGDKGGKFTEASDCEARIVSLLHGYICFLRKTHFARQLQRVRNRRRHGERNERDGDDVQHFKQHDSCAANYFRFLRLLREARLRIRFESSDFARSSSARRERDSPRPARLMK
jgi:hypothetical protein